MYPTSNTKMAIEKAHSMPKPRTNFLFATNGRFYTIPCDKLPGGRGFGEPVRLMADLGNEHDIVGLFLFKTGEKLLVASSGGRGFIVKTDDVIAQTKNGKQALNVKDDDEAAAICPVIGDHVAIIGDNELWFFGRRARDEPRKRRNPPAL